MVRRVEQRSCAFWVTLSVAATVKVRIWKGTREATLVGGVNPVGAGELKTLRVAPNLHVAVVTVDLTGGSPLEPGALYAYDMGFTFDGGASSDLLAEKLLEDEQPGARIAGVDTNAPLHLALGFQKHQLPTFVAPPAKLVGSTHNDRLRLAHASCRRAGGGSFDALAALVPLVADVDERPHQLYLTGDQVYADDIATPLLPLVISLGTDVAGTQDLPGFPPDPRPGGNGAATAAGVPGNLANLPPLRRKWLLWQLAAFTGNDTENHAITFGEFVALHLLAWSPRVWRALPAFADVFKAPGTPGGPPTPAEAIEPWLNRPWFCDHPDPGANEAALKRRWADPTANVGSFEGFNRSAHHLARYAGATPLVAQVLANTPTYMIFDDHEIADDWNLNGRWVTKVYSRPWGRYIIRNGLLAYTLMQGWGNDPAHFATDKPGKKVLDALPAAVTSASHQAGLDVLLGFDAPTAQQPKRISFNYAMETDDYKVVVLDTRTHRAISNTSLVPPNLIDDLDGQLPARPATATQKVLIVVSAAPVLTPVVIDQIAQPLAQLYVDGAHAEKVGEVPGFTPGDADEPARRAGCGDMEGTRGSEQYDREGWSANEGGFESVVARLASYGSVVILSGDVHFASTSTLDYWVKAKQDEPVPPARLVQCISSPAKNVFKDLVDQVIRKVGALQRAEEIPMERLAWKEGIDVAELVPDGGRVSMGRRARLRRRPALVPTAPWPANSKLPTNRSKQPDWRWRIETVVDTATRFADLPDLLKPPVITTTATELDGQLAAIAAAHQLRLTSNRPPLRRIVFGANFGTVHFEGQGAAAEVVHRLHSPKSAAPFRPEEKVPRPAGRPAVPDMEFGPHTVHRAPLKTPTTARPPTIIAGSPGG